MKFDEQLYKNVQFITGPKAQIIRRYMAVVILVLVLYLLNRYLIKPLSLPHLLQVLSRGYVSDFLASIALVSLCNALFACRGFTVHKPWIVAAYTALLALLFELVFPALGANTVSDPFDLVAYALGALAYIGIDTILCRGFA